MNLRDLAEKYNREITETPHLRYGAFLMPFRGGNYHDVVQHMSLHHADKCQDGIMIGIGGGINLSIMSKLNMKGALLVAVDDDQYRLWMNILPIITQFKSKEECRHALAGFIEHNCYDAEYEQPTRIKLIRLNVKYYELKALLGDKYDFPGFLYEPEDELRFPRNPDQRFQEAYVKQTFAFLDNDTAFERVQQRIRSGMVGVVKTNVMNHEHVQKLVDIIGDQYKVALVRLSNILLHYNLGSTGASRSGKSPGYLGDEVQDPEKQLAELDRIFAAHKPLVVEQSTKDHMRRPSPKLFASFSDCAAHSKAYHAAHQTSIS